MKTVDLGQCLCNTSLQPSVVFVEVSNRMHRFNTVLSEGHLVKGCLFFCDKTPNTKRKTRNHIMSCPPLISLDDKLNMSKIVVFQALEAK